MCLSTRRAVSESTQVKKAEFQKWGGLLKSPVTHSSQIVKVISWAKLCAERLFSASLRVWLLFQICCSKACFPLPNTHFFPGSTSLPFMWPLFLLTEGWWTDATVSPDQLLLAAPSSSHLFPAPAWGLSHGGPAIQNSSRACSLWAAVP